MDRCLKSTFSRVAPYWLRASSLFLSYFAWTSFREIPKRCLSNSSFFSRDCQKAHLHKTSTNIRVSGPDFGFLEDMVFILWFILTGVQVSRLHFSPNFQNCKFLLLLSSQIRGVVSLSPTSLRHKKANVQTMVFPTEICLSPAPSLRRLSWPALVLAAW